MDPASLKSLFQPYMQGHKGYGGTGLGLTICKQLCSLMGGHIDLTSAGLNQGCTCTFTLTLLPPSAEWEVDFLPPDVSRGPSPINSLVATPPSFKFQVSVPRNFARWTSIRTGTQSCPFPAGRGGVESTSCLRGRQVLLAVPGSSLRRLLVAHCTSFGMDVTPVATVAEALRILLHPALLPRSGSCPASVDQAPAARRESARGFDAVIIRWHAATSGDDADAHELATAMRRQPRATLLVMCSAFQRDSIQRRLDHSTPFTSVVVQPIQILRLSSALERMMVRAAEVATTPSGSDSAKRLSVPPPRRTHSNSLSPPPVAHLLKSGLAPTRLRVLAADDNVVNRRVLELLLRRLDVDFIVVSDGQEAVTAAAESMFDVILLDLHMPKMGGDAAAVAIRASLPEGVDVPIVIAISGDAVYTGEGAESEPKHASPFDAFLLKPVLLTTLRAALHKLLPDRIPEV
jgi:CheY-like chemotaxis protein